MTDYLARLGQVLGPLHGELGMLLFGIAAVLPLVKGKIRGMRK